MPDHPAPLTPAGLRALALRTLGPRTSLKTALGRMGFVQADPIRAPARAQDLTLMARVRGSRAGDLERLYPNLGAEEDMLPNYGFVTREVQALLHPREVGESPLEREHPELLDTVRAFVWERVEAHPREVAARLGRGRVVNAWGGQSAATTRALDLLHRRGEVRVTRRLGGVRLYGPAPTSRRCGPPRCRLPSGCAAPSTSSRASTGRSPRRAWGTSSPSRASGCRTWGASCARR